MNIRVGYGYDVHQLVSGRPCRIGGLEIPHDKGLAGHSDADVLLHALIDAMLGSVGLGDIGSHFPDSDERWAGADSRDLLRRVSRLLADQGWVIGNIDSTVIAETPKLKPYIEEIRQSISSVLGIGLEDVSVKATTHERLGPLGEGKGIAAHAVVLVKADD